MGELAIKGGPPLVGDRRIGKKWPIADKTDRQALNRVLDSDTWCSGMHEKQTDAEVGKFEIAFAEYQGSEYGCAVTNGTTALDVSLRAGAQAGLLGRRRQVAQQPHDLARSQPVDPETGERR